MHFQTTTTTTILTLLSLTPVALSAPSPQPLSPILSPRANIQADAGALLDNFSSSRDSIRSIVSQSLSDIYHFENQYFGGAASEAIKQNGQQLQEAAENMMATYDAMISAAQQATETVGDVDGAAGAAFGSR